ARRPRRAMSDPIVQDVAGTVVVALGDRSYPIHIVDGAVRDPAAHAPFWQRFCDEAGIRGDVALITNETIAPLYGDALRAAFERAGRRVVLVVVRDGEAFKNAAMLDTM